MFIEKEPRPEAAKAQKPKVPEPVETKKPPKKDMASMTYKEQVKTVSSGKKTAAALPKKSPVEELRALFAQFNMPANLIPNNVEKFTFDKNSGRLVIELKNSFKKEFNEENVLSFDGTITGTLKSGQFTSVTGITKGTASITDIKRVRDGVIGIKGKLGPFSKTLEFKDEDIPPMP